MKIHTHPIQPRRGRPRYDVAVVGAGPGGAAAASFLSREGLRVLLLDRSEFPRDKTCGDGLSPRAIPILEAMGALQELMGEGHSVHGLAIRSPNGESLKAPIPPAPGLPPYALVAPRLTLDERLRQRAVAAGVEFQGGTRLSAIDLQRGHARLVASRRGRMETFQARLVILATGANMGLLERVGVLARRPRFMLAARAYYEGVRASDGRVVFHFDGVPLPGYGWVFPLGDGRVNLGAGFFPGAPRSRNRPSSARQAFEAFIASPGLRPALQGARRVGPVKGYPLRVDFTSALTYGPRLLMVGEAAGLVNPLTGEGIDNALESGIMAARFVSELFRGDDLGEPQLAGYDALLRRRFQRQFLICDWLRALLVNPLLMDRVVRLGRQSPALRGWLLKLALGYPDALESLSLRRILSALLPQPGS